MCSVHAARSCTRLSPCASCEIPHFHTAEATARWWGTFPHPHALPGAERATSCAPVLLLPQGARPDLVVTVTGSEVGHASFTQVSLLSPR